MMIYRLIDKLYGIPKKVYTALIVCTIGNVLPAWSSMDTIDNLSSPSGNGRKVVRILTVDGGGVRGIIPATILEGIEEQLHTGLKSGERKAPLAEHFDIMAGTSTGGIIVLGLNAGMSAEGLAKLYLDHGKTIFPDAGMFNWGVNGPKYDSGPLENLLKDHVGDTWLKNAPSHVLIPADNLGQKCAYLFDSHEAGKLKSHNFKMRDVARATSAAPTYFAAAQIKDEKGNDIHTFVDGGLYANDPAFEAIQAAEKEFPGCDFFILSLGTGEAPRKFGDLSLANGGKVAWAKEISGHLMDRAQDRHLNVLKSLKSLMAQQARTVNYHRIQVFIDPSITALDDVKSIPSLRQAGLFLLNPTNTTSTPEEITKIVKELKYYQKEDALTNFS